MKELIEIKKIVEQVFGVEIHSTRNRDVVEAKAAYCYLACQFTDCKLDDIAKEIDLKNHATVIHHADKNSPALMEVDWLYEKNIRKCEAEIYKLGWLMSRRKKSIKRKYVLAKRMQRKWSKTLYKLEGKMKELNP